MNRVSDTVWTRSGWGKPSTLLLSFAERLIFKGKIDYHTFKPVLFEFPTYEYFVTGKKVGDCGKMNQ